MPRHLLRLGSVAAAATCLVLLLTTGAAAALSAGNGGWRWQNPLPQGGDYTAGYFLESATKQARHFDNVPLWPR